MWEDYIIAASQWVLLAALVPTALHKSEKPTLSTGLVTGGGLAAVALSLASLGLWWGAFGTGLNSMLWFVIAYQRFRLNTRKGAPLR